MSLGCLCVSVSVLFVCLCRRLSPKNLPSWPTSGNARGQSACGGRLRQTLVWPLRWVGARALPRSRPSGFFAGKAGGDTFTNPTLRRLVRAARCRLGAVAGGASRAICVPRQSVPSCRRARPCGLAPRLGLHPPSAAPSPPPSLRSLRRLRYPPCRSGARVHIRPYATWRPQVMTKCVPAILSETRIPNPETRSNNKDSKANAASANGGLGARISQYGPGEKFFRVKMPGPSLFTTLHPAPAPHPHCEKMSQCGRIHLNVIGVFRQSPGADRQNRLR